jgi:hypothetical protein
MIKRTALLPLLLLSVLLLTACNETTNPLLGQWQETSSTGKLGKIITFSPSTMRINDHAVTIVYQIRKDQVRVSASKNAIIYTFENENLIQFNDEKRGIVQLERLSE